MIELPGIQMFKLLHQFSLPFDELCHFLIAHGFREAKVYRVIFLHQIDDMLNAFLDNLAYRF